MKEGPPYRSGGHGIMARARAEPNREDPLCSPPPFRSLPGACIGHLNQGLEGEGISGDIVLGTYLLVHTR